MVQCMPGSLPECPAWCFFVMKIKRDTPMNNGFMNIIRGEDSDAILIYGEIGDWGEVNPREIVTELLSAGYSGRRIDVRINSIGGDVMGGIAIFNLLRSSKADITIYIDGVAASMASVICASGKPVQMSRNGRMMIHSVQGGCWGTAGKLKETAAFIDELETTLADIYAARMGVSTEEVKARYFDGTDHWLTATEALALGLVDGIYDAEPLDADLKPIQVYEHYMNKYTNQFTQTDDEMIEVRKKLGLPDTATEQEVLAKISEIEARSDSSAKDSTIAELTNRIAEYEQREAEAHEAEITALVDRAIAENRITEPQRAHFVAILKADRANGEAILKGIAPAKRAVTVVNGTPPAETAWAKRQREIEETNKKH